MNNIEFAKKIRQRIKDQNLKISDLSVNTGVHRTQIYKIIRGDFVYRSKSVSKICSFLSIDDFSAKPFSIMLDETINLVWDGSEEHAKKINTLLLNIAPLLK